MTQTESLGMRPAVRTCHTLDQWRCALHRTVRAIAKRATGLGNHGSSVPLYFYPHHNTSEASGAVSMRDAPNEWKPCGVHFSTPPGGLTKIEPTRRGMLSEQSHFVMREDLNLHVASLVATFVRSFFVLPCLHTRVPAGWTQTSTPACVVSA